MLAGGASSDLLSAKLGIELPLFPVKGQMLVTNIWPSPVKANVWNSTNVYIVPKKDGWLIVGATEEPSVYDRRPTLGGMVRLSQTAEELVPSLSVPFFVGRLGRYPTSYVVWTPYPRPG